MELAVAIILTLGLLAVVSYDATRFIIPNWLNLAFIAFYPIFLLVTPEHIEWWWSLAVMGIFLAVGLLIFAANIMGGGDVKLLVALSLWIGWNGEALFAFGLWTALSGGILAVFLLLVRFLVRAVSKGSKRVIPVPQIFRKGEPLPYGLAIAYAFGYLLWTNQIQGINIGS